MSELNEIQSAIDSLKQDILEKESKVETLNIQIQDLEASIDTFEYECSEGEYDDFLDELHGDVAVGICIFSASHVLKELDPVAYRCGKVEYESNFDLDDLPEYKEMVSDLEEYQDELSDLEDEIHDLKVDLESLEEDFKDLEEAESEAE